MFSFEIEKRYAELVKKVLNTQKRATRNDDATHSIFGEMFSFELRGYIPLLTGRKIFYRGVLGELAAMLRKPHHINDFKRFGCNFWDTWGDENGYLDLDYGRQWYAHNQIAELKRCLKEDRESRRMIINAWNPANLKNLSLPCCHLLYQFYCNHNELSMNWYQRSVDVMIGMPSNMVFSSALLIMIANEFNMKPHKINMIFGDCHIYSRHVEPAYEYLQNLEHNLEDPTNKKFRNHGKYKLTVPPQYDFTKFTNSNIDIFSMKKIPTIKFDLYK